MIGYVANILPFSSVDGPGNRTVVFLQGCNLDCAYCHNPETIEMASEKNVPEGACEMSVEEVVSAVSKYQAFLSGVTISGGECTVQYGFLMELIEAFHKIGLEVYVDTNGLLAEEKMRKLIEAADGFMLDVKAFDKGDHKRLTGAENEVIIHNFNHIAQAGKLYEVRTVVVPGLLNNLLTVKETAKRIARYDGTIRYKIIRYRPHGVRKERIQSDSPNDDLMNMLVKAATENGCSNIILV